MQVTISIDYIYITFSFSLYVDPFSLLRYYNSTTDKTESTTTSLTPAKHGMILFFFI